MVYYSAQRFGGDLTQNTDPPSAEPTAEQPKADFQQRMTSKKTKQKQIKKTGHGLATWPADILRRSSNLARPNANVGLTAGAAECVPGNSEHAAVKEIP